VTATLENVTNRTLTLSQCQLEHGVFTQSPPEVIANNTQGVWKSESDGISWTEGSCTYNIEGVLGQAFFSWDDPPIGDNEYSATAPEQEGFSAAYSGGSGFQAVVLYTLTYIG